MKPKHTLGPWIFREETIDDIDIDSEKPIVSTRRRIRSVVDDEIVVADDYGVANLTSDTLRLIAAAPELLEALIFAENVITANGTITDKEMRRAKDPLFEAVKAMRTAVSKARGES